MRAIDECFVEAVCAGSARAGLICCCWESCFVTTLFAFVPEHKEDEDTEEDEDGEAADDAAGDEAG